MFRIDSFVIPTALWRFTGIRTRLVFQRLDASCPRDVTGRCQNEEAGMKGSETASAARVIPAQYNPVIPAQYNPVIPAKAGIYGGKGLDPRLRGDDGAGRAGMTVQEGAKTVQGPDSTALWEMGFARRMAPQAPKARNLTLAAVLRL